MTATPDKKPRRRGLIEILLPGWARKRMEARIRMDGARRIQESFSTYDAAAINRTTVDWPWKPKSANQEIIPDSKIMNGRVRRAADNNWAAASIIGAYKRHLTGRGITAKAAARDPHADPTDRVRDPNSPYEVYNRQLDALWTYWSTHPRLIDIERRKGMTGIQRLMVSDFATVGQSLLIHAMENRGPDEIGMVLQVCEPEQLATDQRTPRNKNATVVGGIEINDFGAPLGYWFYTRKHPLESYRATPVFVDADRVHQFMDQSRVRQTYGVSKLAPVITKLWHMEMYDEYQLIRAKVEACICAVLIENKAANGPMGLGQEPTAAEGTTDTRGTQVDRLEPGTIKRIQANSGEDIKFLNPSTPGNNYDPFITSQVGQAAAGAMMDFAVVAREYRKATYSSQREARLERYCEIETLQIVMIEQVLQPTMEEFVRTVILQGLLKPLPNYFTDPLVRAASVLTEWKPPPRIGIDPAKDALAAKIQFELGLATARGKLNELGADWREVFQEIADEKAWAKHLGINIGWLMGEIAKVDAANPEESDDPDNADEPEGRRTEQSRGRSGGNGDGIARWMAGIANRD